MPTKTITPERLAQAREIYEHTSIPVRVIADDLGVTAMTVSRWARKWRWAERSARVPKIGPPPTILPSLPPSLPPVVALPGMSPVVPPSAAVPPPPPDPDRPADAGPPPAEPPSRERAALRLQERIERELTAIESIIASLGPGSQKSGDAERVARTLATLLRTLRDLTRLHPAKPEPEGADDAVPRSVDELRRALTEKLERIVGADEGELHREP